MKKMRVLKEIQVLWRMEKGKRGAEKWVRVATQPAGDPDHFYSLLQKGVTYKERWRDEHGYWSVSTIFHLNERGERVAGEA